MTQPTEETTLSKLRAHLTYANVMATTAVFMVLGGGAWAASNIPRNSVGPPQIQANAVGASEIASDGVGSKEVAAKAIGGQQIAPQAVGGSDIRAGSISARQIAPDAVGGQELARASVKAEQLAAGAVKSQEIEDGSVQEADVAAALLAQLRAPTAFGHVNADGTIDTANSRNLVAVADNNAGVYCLNATGVAPKTANVTLEITGTGAVTDQTRVSLSPAVLTTNCAGFPQADIIVETTNSAGAGVTRPFYISVD